MNNRKMCNKMIANNIKRIRVSKSLTQREVALAIQISTRRYCYYETAKREIPLYIMIRLSEYYKIKTDNIINYKVG
jgi:transcriptional regulator with XRE-family HTH domain